MTHVLTGDYLGAPYGSTAFSWSTYATWLTWAEPGQDPDSAAMAAVGMKTMLYTNPNRQAPGDPMYTSDESTFAHTCSGSRITNIHFANNMYLMDPSSTALRGLWASVVSLAQSRGHYDAIFEDDADDLLQLTANPCNVATWLTSSETEIQSLGKPVIYNGLGVLVPPYGISEAINLNPYSIGGMMEECYAQPSPRPKTQGTVWQTTENTQIQMAAAGKIFICYAKNFDPAQSSVDTRLYTYASFMLTYDPSTSLLWEYFSNPSGFHVEPESQIVPEYPLASTPLTINGLQLAGGAYGREYGACYVNGHNAGPCAALVNPNYYSTASYPYGTKYQHTLVLSGGGILDGGTIATNGSPPPSTIPTEGSLIVFR